LGRELRNVLDALRQSAVGSGGKLALVSQQFTALDGLVRLVHGTVASWHRGRETVERRCLPPPGRMGGTVCWEPLDPAVLSDLA
jgi:hypothetical protein